MQTTISYFFYALHTRWENIFGRLGQFICLSKKKKKLVWPWRKSHWSLCKASPCLCCIVLLQWWEELDLSQITQPPSGLPVHCCQLRRGRLWIAEVVPAFYQNYSKFRAVFPKHNMKSVAVIVVRQLWMV